MPICYQGRTLAAGGLRNYQDVVKESGGEILYTCKKEECGGDPERSSEGGGGEMSLMMYFVYANQLKDADFSNGKCALTPYVDDQRFFAAKIPQGGDAYVTVQTFQVKDNLYCKAFNERTVALVHIVEPKPREQKMVVVKAEEMARSIGTTGRIALYGIFFDTDKAELKPKSGPTLAEIAGLLKNDPKLAVLIVGHTDNQGTFDHNLDLSPRTASGAPSILPGPGRSAGAKPS